MKTKPRNYDKTRRRIKDNVFFWEDKKIVLEIRKGIQKSQNKVWDKYEKTLLLKFKTKFKEGRV